ncbi:LacI family transcriptional regulator [Brachybacterium endophyticum]|uniref:LacI family transcriptional regulator n=1 Tax=Brachybacterium endophyticum TaxID=2182385 RepID=A0A2U2RJE6_9MICO|nr:LacI family DNA-binding transcriptional regulator [Brachybacterium endophyticum]PWH05988.1 LacI family transcriptional regulator [Brachybacterium endophyticum]
MAEKESVTIYDVAREVGCAPSTVSRAFSRPGRVSAATHAKVMEAARRLGYRVEAPDQQERTGRQGRLGVATPDLSNPYFAEVLTGMQEAAHAAEYLPILLDSGEDEDRERAALERSLEVVDGIVLTGTRLSDATLLQLAKRVPMMVLNRRVAGLDSVTPDYEHGMSQAMAHLESHQVRTVTYVAGPANSWSDGERWRSARTRAAEHGIRVNRIGPFPPTSRGGEDAYAELVESTRAAGEPLPEGVICYNDLQALGLLVAALRDGVRVPQELSVIGHDDIPLSRLVGAGLTTVAAPKREQGRAAVDRIVRRIRQPSSIKGPVEGALPVRLVVRGSTGPSGRR